jgi:hypothetical protein
VTRQPPKTEPKDLLWLPLTAKQGAGDPQKIQDWLRQNANKNPLKVSELLADVIATRVVVDKRFLDCVIDVKGKPTRLRTSDVLAWLDRVRDERDR